MKKVIVCKNGLPICNNHPFHCILEKLNIPVAFRNAFYVNFPKSQYLYVDLPNTKLTTTDGMHLPKDEALKYILYFKSKVKSLFQENTIIRDK
jgi:hypothetical protein